MRSVGSEARDSERGVGVSGQERITVERCPACSSVREHPWVDTLNHRHHWERREVLLLPSSVVDRDEAIERAARALQEHYAPVYDGPLGKTLLDPVEVVLRSVGYLGGEE